MISMYLADAERSICSGSHCVWGYYSNSHVWSIQPFVIQGPDIWETACFHMNLLIFWDNPQMPCLGGSVSKMRCLTKVMKYLPQQHSFGTNIADFQQKVKKILFSWVQWMISSANDGTSISLMEFHDLVIDFIDLILFLVIGFMLGLFVCCLEFFF